MPSKRVVLPFLTALDRPRLVLSQGLHRRTASVMRTFGTFAAYLSVMYPGWAWAQSTPENGTQSALGAWVEASLPNFLRDITVLDVTLWQWISLLILVCASSIAGFIITHFVFRSIHKFALKSVKTWDELVVERSAAPFRLVASTILFYFSTLPLSLSAQSATTLAEICKVLGIVSVAWLLSRMIDTLGLYIERRLEREGETGKKMLVPLGRRVTKIFILTIVGLFLIQNLGFSISGLLTGLGIGGLAVALASQKTIENLFGGFMIVADRPVKIGDFCKIGEHLGTVEDIGLRSSQIRTLDRTVVSIPNAEMSTARIENYGIRDKIRYYTILQVGYDTAPDQMRHLLVQLRRMLYSHPKVLADPCRVRFMSFGAHSLDIEVFAFADTKDWQEFTAIREDMNLRIMDIVRESGAYFAYPSQTLYLGRHGGGDSELAESAEQKVAEWRSSDALPMPEFPPDLITELDDSLAYPPKGSAVADPATSVPAKPK